MRPSKPSTIWLLVAVIAILWFIAATQIGAVKCLVRVAKLAASNAQLSQSESRWGF